MPGRKKSRMIMYAVGAIGVGLATYLYMNKSLIDRKISQAQAATDLQQFNAEELGRFDGTDADLPIYLALDGYVYDVTAGSKFYVTGGDYHYLSGKDASADLKMFGGDIIKKKYPIIGRFIQ